MDKSFFNMLIDTMIIWSIGFPNEQQLHNESLDSTVDFITFNLFFDTQRLALSYYSAHCININNM